MHSVILKTPSLFPISNPKFNQLNPTNRNSSKPEFKSSKCYLNSNLKVINPLNQPPILAKPSSQIDRIADTHFPNQLISSPNLAKTLDQSPILFKPSSLTSKIQFLSSEFSALPEQLEKVKRLLHYASLLSPLHELYRVESNRVTGCTTQVWLEAKIDSEGLVWFRADSDSEITKGFCYCLVWALNGAAPAEVLAVSAEDLAEMNVGFSGRSGRSRVNTWQNVLLGMQRRTKALAEERERLEGLPSLLLKFQDLSGTEERLLSPEVAQLS